MKYLIITIVALLGLACLVPAVKGPVNRARNELNDKLNAEYVVDNYKAEYVKLHEKKATVIESMRKYNIEKKVAEKKLDQAKAEVKTAKSYLKKLGTADMKKFQAAKSVYEVKLAEVDNYTKMIAIYNDAVEKLDKTLALIDSNMIKAKHNVDVLTSKKNMVDTIKTVNKSLENLAGIGDTDLAINVEKLDDDMIRETVKLETLDAESKSSADMDEVAAKTWLETLK